MEFLAPGLLPNDTVWCRHPYHHPAPKRVHASCSYLPTSTVLARAPPLALLLPLEDDEPRESLEELLMLSLSCPLPQEVAAHPPRRGRRLSVGELSDVVSGALLSILAIPSEWNIEHVRRTH